MTHTPVHSSDLDVVLKFEQELAERLTIARADAERMLREARDDVARQEAGIEAELERQARELEARLRVEREQRLAAMAQEAGQRLARWEQIDDGAVDRAASMVVDALIAGPRGARR